MTKNSVTIAMLQVAMQNAIKKSHAVGDVIMRWNDRDPAVDFGGTWERTAQGRFPLGASSTGGGWLLGAEGGEAEHTLAVSEMPKHNHDGLYWANVNTLSFDQNGNKSGYILQKEWSSAVGSSNFTNNTAGNSQPHNNMPPYVVFNFWKKIEE